MTTIISASDRFATGNSSNTIGRNEIVNNDKSTRTDVPISANQGRIFSNKIKALDSLEYNDYELPYMEVNTVSNFNTKTTFTPSIGLLVTFTGDGTFVTLGGGPEGNGNFTTTNGTVYYAKFYGTNDSEYSLYDKFYRKDVENQINNLNNMVSTLSNNGVYLGAITVNNFNTKTGFTPSSGIQLTFSDNGIVNLGNGPRESGSTDVTQGDTVIFFGSNDYDYDVFQNGKDVMLKTSNLNDVDDVIQSRINLGLGSSQPNVGDILIGNGTDFNLGQISGTSVNVDSGTDFITLNVAPSYSGGSNISSLGTITSGTWNATLINPSYGGTGVTAPNSDGQLLIGSSSGSYTLATITNGTVDAVNGAGSISLNVSPSYTGGSNISTLGTITSGTWNSTVVDAQYGGTGLNTSSASNGQLLIGTGSGLSLGSISGSANKIDVTNGSGTIELDLSSSYEGQTSISTLGTITSGTWNSTVVDAQYGGTGLDTSSASNGQLLIGTGSGLSLGSISGSTNKIDVTNGSGTIGLDLSSSYEGQTSISTVGTITTGTWNGDELGVQYGGTGFNSMSNGELLIGNNSGSLDKVKYTDIFSKYIFADINNTELSYVELENDTDLGTTVTVYASRYDTLAIKGYQNGTVNKVKIVPPGENSNIGKTREKINDLKEGDWFEVMVWDLLQGNETDGTDAVNLIEGDALYVKFQNKTFEGQENVGFSINIIGRKYKYVYDGSTWFFDTF